MSHILRQHRVTPDLDAAVANLKRRRPPERVFYYEHGEEPGIKQALCDRFNLCQGLHREDPRFMQKREIRIKMFLGHEWLRIFPGGIVWPGLPRSTTAAPPALGPIQSWRDFEQYAWPEVHDVDFSDAQWYEHHLPPGIAMFTMTYLFQQVSNLLGFEPLCYLLVDDRPLVEAVTRKVGEFYVKLTETICDFTRCGAINIADDMGHKTSTLVHPDDLRSIFMPWQARIIQAARTRGKVGLFHSCGQIESIMDDLIEVVGIEARHSTQDVIEPMVVSKRRWGDRIALLGGVDVDFITRAQPEQVRGYCRNILETCVPTGGFAFGVGNWVADSIPFDNYIAMLEVARTFM